ncbi:MAG: DUF1961 family protein [Tepidisphaeraceae bacterium]
MNTLMLVTASLAGLVSMAGCASSAAREKPLLLEENFANLDRWRLEGLTEGASITPAGELRLDCKSKMGFHGVMAFCKQDFPDNIAIEYDFLCEKHNGLFITFVAMTGVNGEDAITGVPPRTGVFEDYYNGTRSYHASICRYADDGTHTGVSNWRRNPGLNLMVSGQDLCQEAGRTYHVKITKRGPQCIVEVDGQRGAAFTDPKTLPGPIPAGGKFGFRAIGADAVFRVWNVRVTALEP